MDHTVHRASRLRAGDHRPLCHDALAASIEAQTTRTALLETDPTNGRPVDGYSMKTIDFLCFDGQRNRVDLLEHVYQDVQTTVNRRIKTTE